MAAARTRCPAPPQLRLSQAARSRRPFRGDQWRRRGDGFRRRPLTKRSIARNLGLADLSPLPRTGFKGSGAVEWLRGPGPGHRAGEQPRLSPGRRRGGAAAGARREIFLIDSLAGSGRLHRQAERGLELGSGAAAQAHRLSHAPGRQPWLVRPQRQARAGDVRQDLRHRSAPRQIRRTARSPRPPSPR